MSASAASSGRPAWAVCAWSDNNAIYIEIPAKSGIPYISKFALSEGGLSKALSLMRSLHRTIEPLGGNYQIPLNPGIKKAQTFSEDSRKATREILKRLKIT